ncbi:MAG: CHASE2 domain-containing protein [Desulfatiglans sp.]|jgi:serine/threonine-protein kinase|nr:CHASE2 domain-containing protein [Desulfatiglans sp.]
MKLHKLFSDWVIGLITTVIFVVLFFSGAFSFINTIELKSYDLRAYLAASSDISPDIELVTITDEDINTLGRWPWTRSIIARCIDNLHEAGAKVIALNIFFSEPEENAGLMAIKRLKQEFDEMGLAQIENNGIAFYQKMVDAEMTLDSDTRLEQSIKNAGNVVIPFFFDSLSQGRDETAPAFVSRDSLKKINSAGEESIHDIIWFSKITPPLNRFADVAAGSGHNHLFPDTNDGAVRIQRHVLGYLNDIYLPSYAVSIVRLFKGLKDDNMTISLDSKKGSYIDYKITPGPAIRVPLLEYDMGTLVNWKKEPGIAFHQTRFTKVLNKEIRMNIFKDKIVIIGHVASGIGDKYKTPVSEQMPVVELLANTVDNILNQRFYLKPFWTGFITLAALLFFGVFITFILPGLRTGTGAVTAFILFIAYGTTAVALFLNKNIWLDISLPLMILVIGYILIITKRFLTAGKTKKKVAADSLKKDYKDFAEKTPKLKEAEDTMIFGGEAGRPGGVGAALKNYDTSPTFRRYNIISELGRGAMGTVYKGVDLKIDRTVAIKTVRLSDFDEGMIKEMKERFFREAESAGLLSHPNIVKIYDAGEEGDLAYIAMEYLNGKDLGRHTVKGNLLPIRETLSIAAQVAEALDFAHGKGIVHRDIKPANIMRINVTGEIKVTDFGIARITTSSRTKTGIIMGTPSYMSPEQVSGEKVDGRSDIFSLGVVLFELLCGEKPFAGDDITSLMYMIAKEKQSSLKTINPRVPGVVEKIVDKALEKEAAKRYQKAGHMALHLRTVIKKIDEISDRKKPV